MGSDIFEINDGGARLKVWLGLDINSALMIALAIFMGITLSLFIYAKIK